MRVLALDLGTKTLGLAISDKTNTISSPLKVLRHDGEHFDEIIKELSNIITENEIDTVVLGNPKNMDNSEGFASQRSQNFKKIIDKELNIKTILIDERLSTVEAENILIQSDLRRNKRKKVIDSAAAMIILDTYLRSVKNDWKYN